MTLASVASRPRSRHRWWGLVALVLGVQLGLIFWLGETTPIRQRPAAPGLTLRLAGSGSAELRALHDPTLFVLPHPPNLSAPERPKTPPPRLSAFTWPEPTNHAPPAFGSLDVALNQLAETNGLIPLLSPARPEPQLSLPALSPHPMPAGASTVRVEGGLARRRLLTPLDLRPQTNWDILTNSVVQVLVDAEGLTRSVTLLSSSGSKPADQQALGQASAARFAPLSRDPAGPNPGPTTGLDWGRMVFLWHTVPEPATNARPVSP